MKIRGGGDLPEVDVTEALLSISRCHDDPGEQDRQTLIILRAVWDSGGVPVVVDDSGDPEAELIAGAPGGPGVILRVRAGDAAGRKT